VSGDIVGRPVNAVLVPPQAERFASLTEAAAGSGRHARNSWRGAMLSSMPLSMIASFAAPHRRMMRARVLPASPGGARAR
jgi:hypothetical protein